MRRMVLSVHGHPRAAVDALRPEEVAGDGYRVLFVALVVQDRSREPHDVWIWRSRRPLVVVVRGKGDLRRRRAHVICEKEFKLGYINESNLKLSLFKLCTNFSGRNIALNGFNKFITTLGYFFSPSTQPISVSGPHLPFSWQVSDGLEGWKRLWSSQEKVSTSP